MELAPGLATRQFGLLGPIANDKAILLRESDSTQILVIDSRSGTATQIGQLEDFDGKISMDGFRSAYANGVVAIFAGTNPAQ